MATKVQTTLSLDRDIKNQSAQLLDDLGLNLSTYVNMALHQLIREQKIPFTVGNPAMPVDSNGYPIMNLKMNDPAILQPEVHDGAIVLPSTWDDEDED